MSLHRCKFTLLTFFSSLSSSRYFKFPNSTQQQKKTYHKTIKQSQTVYEQSPNHSIRHHVPTATDQGTPNRNRDLGHPRSLIFRCLLAGEGRGKTRGEQTEYWALIPCRTSFPQYVFKLSTFVLVIHWCLQQRGYKSIWVLVFGGTFIPDGKKRVYVKFFTFVFLLPMEVFKIQEDCPLSCTQRPF